MKYTTTVFAVLLLSACQPTPPNAINEMQPWEGALPVGIDRGLPHDYKDGGFFLNNKNGCFYQLVDGGYERLPDDPDTGKPACIGTE
ncbi:hypothetical protein [Rhodalgimonas zhirmunskyi]|uniref:Lipoprotein n=1 Tax=Rhodalgimonas zhirmunskyi TaxID=2964767 RepID=A0AAJ1U2Y1_9RHOB|nr:hypothetical protein [Rhodoalgimonas zhirmunskyi]MDQ2092716.1 hypothetical protein [Rhodoalgimonas zhirmunskyi]